MDVSATGPRAKVRRPMNEDASQDPSSSGNHVTPEELLASLPITRELKRLISRGRFANVVATARKAAQSR